MALTLFNPSLPVPVDPVYDTVLLPRALVGRRRLRLGPTKEALEKKILMLCEFLL